MQKLSITLRRLLIADALVSLASGALLCLGAAPLADFLRMPRQLLFWVGVILLPFAAANAWLARRAAALRLAVQALILWNFCWAAESVLAMLTGWLQPSLAGTLVMLGQAFVVASLASFQYFDTRSRRSAAGLTAQPDRHAESGTRRSLASRAMVLTPLPPQPDAASCPSIAPAPAPMAATWQVPAACGGPPG
jgi:hypothetical protein